MRLTGRQQGHADQRRFADIVMTLTLIEPRAGVALSRQKISHRAIDRLIALKMLRRGIIDVGLGLIGCGRRSATAGASRSTTATGTSASARSPARTAGPTRCASAVPQIRQLMRMICKKRMSMLVRVSVTRFIPSRRVLRTRIRVHRTRRDRFALRFSFPRRSSSLLYILLKLRLAPENMMIVLREPMRFIANILKHFQPTIVSRKSDRLALRLRVDQLFLLRERNHHRRLHVHRLEHIHRRVKLPNPPSIRITSG